jgi:hypothetical protein
MMDDTRIGSGAPAIRVTDVVTRAEAVCYRASLASFQIAARQARLSASPKIGFGWCVLLEFF